MRVAILGCGPAGLFAAQAVSNFMEEWGMPKQDDYGSYALQIFSKKRPSRLYGAQYLHRPIPGASPTEIIQVEYLLDGDADSYRRKVYGSLWDGTVSPEEYVGDHEAWDIRGTYRALWEKFAPNIIDFTITPADLQPFLNGHWDVVINTIPLNMLCYRGHTFGYTTIKAAGDAPELGLDVNRTYNTPDDTVICNGHDMPSWYRKSRIFGHTTVEWPENIEPPIPHAAVTKPTYHACDCWPNLVKVGRYGSWTKGVLSHDAYFDTMKFLQGRFVNLKEA